MDKEKKLPFAASSRESGNMLNYNKETQDLQNQLLNIQKQIADLTKLKRKLKKQIEIQGHKPVSDKSRKKYEKFFSTPINLYVLELEDECWYIGQSRNVAARFNKHLTGRGANWTKLHKPLRIAHIKNTSSTDEQEASLLEDKLTLEYAKKHGTFYVRGGGYCQSKPKWPLTLFE